MYYDLLITDGLRRTMVHAEQITLVTQDHESNCSNLVINYLRNDRLQMDAAPNFTSFFYNLQY